MTEPKIETVIYGKTPPPPPRPARLVDIEWKDGHVVVILEVDGLLRTHPLILTAEHATDAGVQLLKAGSQDYMPSSRGGGS